MTKKRRKEEKKRRKKEKKKKKKKKNKEKKKKKEKKRRRKKKGRKLVDKKTEGKMSKCEVGEVLATRSFGPEFSSDNSGDGPIGPLRRWAAASSVQSGTGLSDRQMRWVEGNAREWGIFGKAKRDSWLYYVDVEEYLGKLREQLGEGEDLLKFIRVMREGEIGGFVGFRDYLRVVHAFTGVRATLDEEGPTLAQRRQTAGRREIWSLFQNISEGSWSVEALELLGQLKVRSLGGVDLEDAAELVSRQFGREEEVAFPVFSRLVMEFTRRRLKRRVFGALRDMWKCGSGREGGAGEVMMKMEELNRVAGGGAPVGPGGHGPAPRCGFVPFGSGDSGPHLQETGGKIRDLTVLAGDCVVKMMRLSEDGRSCGERRRRSRCGRAGRPRHAWRKHGRRGKTVKRKRRGVTERLETRQWHGRLRRMWKTYGLRRKRRRDKRPRGPPGVRSEGTRSRGFRKARIGCAFLGPGLGPDEEITYGVDSEFRWLVLMGTRGGEG
jgi:hypothetical protein